MHFGLQPREAGLPSGSSLSAGADLEAVSGLVHLALQGEDRDRGPTATTATAPTTPPAAAIAPATAAAAATGIAHSGSVPSLLATATEPTGPAPAPTGGVQVAGYHPHLRPTDHQDGDGGSTSLAAGASDPTQASGPTATAAAAADPDDAAAPTTTPAATAAGGTRAAL